MLLPETKEREYRFKLALRMGLPIFFLILAFISDTFINSFESIQPSFYFTSILLLAFSIYFIFFLIYKGFDVKITESVSKTFTREYLYQYLNKKLNSKEDYTLILLSIDNLHAINTNYGLRNGDKVLFEVAQYIEKYFKDKSIINFPMGHIKGGDFIIGLKGKKESFKTILELLCLKSAELKVDEIEVQISGAITDTVYSNKLEYMIENLFEIQEENKNKKTLRDENNINPNEIELFVINAINKKLVTIMTQEVYSNSKEKIQECFVKLKDSNGKVLHPKSYIKIVNKLGLRAEYDILILEKSIVHSLNKTDKVISVSVSPNSIRNYNFFTKVQDLLQNNPKAKDKIILMISETEYYSHIQRYNTTLQSLRRNGIKIGIDRLGSLHTSFLYLRDLDIDIVRFDSYYSKEIQSDKHKKMLSGFNTMAHSLGVKTWLKMVENKEIDTFAKELNIDYRQGKELAPLIKII